MTHPRALTEQTAITLERWYTEFECLGTVAAKCKELGISRVTFYDTIRRVRGEDTKPMREKLGAIVPRESLQTVEEHSETETT